MAAHDDETTVDQTRDDGGSGASDAGDLTDALGTSEETTFITEEKKPVNRTSILLFGVLLLGAAGYYFMYARTGPASADAATVTEAAQQADETISQFLSSGEENARVMQQLRQTTDKVVAQFKSSEVPQVPVADLQANPFKYAPAADDAAAAAAAAAKKREEERAAATAAVQTLQLQSILTGAKPACMINNQMYTEGQVVSGFTVEKISPGAIIVKSGSLRFQLKMQR